MFSFCARVAFVHLCCSLSQDRNIEYRKRFEQKFPSVKR